MSKLNNANSLLQKLWSLMRRKASLVVVMILLVVVPLAAHGQLGLDPCCAIISAGLNSISGLLKSVVATPLSSIQQLRQQAADFEQQIVYPVSAINNARGLAEQLRGQLQQMTQLYRLPLNSASLPSPQQLEQSLLSHNPQTFAQIGQSYSAVYGSVMAPADAPQPMRDLVDMADAEAQAA